MSTVRPVNRDNVNASIIFASVEIISSFLFKHVSSFLIISTFLNVSMNRTNKPSLLSELNSGDMFDRQLTGVSQFKSISKANYFGSLQK